MRIDYLFRTIDIKVLCCQNPIFLWLVLGRIRNYCLGDHMDCNLLGELFDVERLLWTMNRNILEAIIVNAIFWKTYTIVAIEGLAKRSMRKVLNFSQAKKTTGSRPRPPNVKLMLFFWCISKLLCIFYHNSDNLGLLYKRAWVMPK